MAYHLPLVVAFSLRPRIQFVWGGCMLLPMQLLRPDRLGILEVAPVSKNDKQSIRHASPAYCHINVLTWRGIHLPAALQCSRLKLLHMSQNAKHRCQLLHPAPACPWQPATDPCWHAERAQKSCRWPLYCRHVSKHACMLPAELVYKVSWLPVHQNEDLSMLCPRSNQAAPCGLTQKAEHSRLAYMAGMAGGRFFR